MKFILTNAFSINMLKRSGQDLAFIPVNVQAVKNIAHNERLFETAIGHADTARVIGGILGIDIPVNRANVELIAGETSLIVAQYTGPRLPEGATKLPENAKIEFWQVYHYE